MNAAQALNEVERLQQEYLEDYEMLSETIYGQSYYTPSKFELELITDAIDGLLSDDQFINALVKWKSL